MITELPYGEICIRRLYFAEGIQREIRTAPEAVLHKKLRTFQRAQDVFQIGRGPRFEH